MAGTTLVRDSTAGVASLPGDRWSSTWKDSERSSDKIRVKVEPQWALWKGWMLETYTHTQRTIEPDYPTHFLSTDNDLRGSTLIWVQVKVTQIDHIRVSMTTKEEHMCIFSVGGLKVRKPLLWPTAGWGNSHPTTSPHITDDGGNIQCLPHTQLCTYIS